MSHKQYTEFAKSTTSTLRHLKYQNLWMNNKVRSDKMQFVCICIG